MPADNPSNVLVEYLSNHPRLIGALFTVGLLTTQASAALANAGTSNPGP